MKQVTSNLFRDNVLVGINMTDTQLMDYVHSHHSFSLSHAIEHEGYRVALYSPYVKDIHGLSAVCAETGKVFTLAPDGAHTSNYATSRAGELISDAGVDIRERRALLDRSKPYDAYVGTSHPAFTGDASIPRTITGWKGNVLMNVVSSRKIRLTRMSHTHGKYIYTIIACDIHGGMWYGRGNAGICITMRAYKTA